MEMFQHGVVPTTREHQNKYGIIDNDRKGNSHISEKL